MKKKIIMGLFVLVTVIGMGFAFDEYKQSDLLIAQGIQCYNAENAIELEEEGNSVKFINKSESHTITVSYRIKYFSGTRTSTGTVRVSPLSTEKISVSGKVTSAEITKASYCD